jgi:pyruvate/2-oxoglutarate dehydrogenase complex dihydrolipoamide acyltransferase (E2) component
VSSWPTDRASEAGAVVQVTMPQMGVSVAEGTIVEWHKRPGDWVEADETICEISTDKVDTEIPSPASGRVVRVLVEPNETVPVGAPLAEIDVTARPGEAHAAEHEGAAHTADRSHVISPVVQRMATEHQIDLSEVKGTGVGGRIRKKDLMAYIEATGPKPPREAAAPGRSEPATAPPLEAGRPETAEAPLHTESPYRPQSEERDAPAAPVVDGAGGAAPARREPMSIMRRQIAEHMLRSRRSAAHCTTVAEVDMGKVAERRAELKPAYVSRGVPLTYLAFVARAAVSALREHPILNASIEGEEIVYHDDVNLGIAVALEDGLIVPVIARAQHLSLEGIAAAIADLSTRARSKRLSPEEVAGGTFTITNPGQFGTVLATPIINQPQVAILDLEAVVKRPTVVSGDGGDAIAIRPMANLCLSFDHRALDGAVAARFLGTLKGRLEDWMDDS